MIALTMILVLWAAPTSSAPRPQVVNSWLTYNGAWFEVKYPATFKVRPSQRSSSSNGYDSVFFIAADRSVEFYVFSPQWNGTPRDIEINNRGELLASETFERRAGKIVHRATITARDGSYTRSFEDTEDTRTNTRRVFGIKYANAVSYKRYRSAYLTFKASLKQFAD